MRIIFIGSILLSVFLSNYTHGEERNFHFYKGFYLEVEESDLEGALKSYKIFLKLTAREESNSYRKKALDRVDAILKKIGDTDEVTGSKKNHSKNSSKDKKHDEASTNFKEFSVPAKVVEDWLRQKEKLIANKKSKDTEFKLAWDKTLRNYLGPWHNVLVGREFFSLEFTIEEYRWMTKRFFLNQMEGYADRRIRSKKAILAAKKDLELRKDLNVERQIKIAEAYLKKLEKSLEKLPENYTGQMLVGSRNTNSRPYTVVLLNLKSAPSKKVTALTLKHLNRAPFINMAGSLKKGSREYKKVQELSNLYKVIYDQIKGGKIEDAQKKINKLKQWVLFGNKEGVRNDE